MIRLGGYYRQRAGGWGAREFADQFTVAEYKAFVRWFHFAEYEPLT